MTRLLCAVLLIWVHASPATAQVTTPDTTVLERVITIELRNVPLHEALGQVARAAELRLSYSPEMLPLDRRVTLVRGRVTAGVALRALLDGTGVTISFTPSGLVILTPAAPPPRALRGRITDSVTGAPIAGVVVSTVENGVVAESDASGSFTLHADARRLVVRRIGYRTSSVLVPPAGEVVMNIALTPAALAIDRMEVVGRRVSAVEPEPTYASTTLRPAELAGVQPRTLGELFRAGATVLAQADGTPAPRLRVTGIRGATSLALSPPKVYLDGVELAQPQYAGVIDPAMIERIEIVRGPQGAALYGSDAIGGVVHIITRKGAPGEDAGISGEIRSATGWNAAAVSGRTSWQTDQFAAASYTGSRVAMTTGASLLRLGSIADGGGSRTGAFAGARAGSGRVAAEVSLHASGQTWRSSVNDVLREHGFSRSLPRLDEAQRMRQFTAGVTIRALAPVCCTHTLAAGHDHVTLDVVPERLAALSPPDSVLGAARGVTDRTSVRYTSLLRIPLATGAALASAGAEVARLSHAATDISGPRTSGRQTAPATARTDRGAFARVEITFPRLLLSAGLRAEHSSAFGDDHGAAWLPSVGASYGADAGPLALRFRTAWGRAIRPAAPAPLSGTQRFTLVENPGLAPEEQTGLELGMDVAMGGLGVISITRFDQTVDDLVHSVPLQTDMISQQNVGRIANRGWEAELTVTSGNFSLRASHTAVDSRVVRLTRAYAGELQAGDRVPEVPASTTALTLGHVHGKNSVALTGVRIGEWQSYDWIRLYRDRQTGARTGTPRDYRINYPPLVRIDLSLARRLSSGVEALVKLGNITGERRSGRDNLETAPGRSLSAGLRIH
ncbi:MAG TPA: TonB-dependent receptor [Longimicrobiales bacterium]|nr:TonB-dependent receptor [Longimicrobiales bacterium]